MMLNPMLSSPAIEMVDVWKVFGHRRAEALQAAIEGRMSKQEILQRYECVLAVAGASISVQPGEIFCIMGLSGSGKSTLVRHINRLINPTLGRIIVVGDDIGTFDDENLRKLRAEKLGMVFQNMALFPHRTVLDNVSLGLEVQGKSKVERARMAGRVLDLVGLDGWGWRKPAELSGGMQQRVGLARALATDPDILLMDEPFSVLDPLIRRQLQEQFIEISTTHKKTTVFITHDLDEAIRIGDRIAIMKDGKIVQVGTPEDIVTNPADGYVADFVSGISRLKLVTAGRIMTPATPNERYDLSGVCVGEDANLDEIINLSIETDAPVMVINQENLPVGTIDKVTLLRGIQGETTSAPNFEKPATGMMPVDSDPMQSAGIAKFVGYSDAYYIREFGIIDTRGLFAKSVNLAAATFGPLWAAARGIWRWFAVGAFAEIFAFVQIARGAFGNLGADQMARAQSLQAKAVSLAERAATALAEGNTTLHATLSLRGKRLLAGSDEAMARATADASQSTTLLLIGIFVFLVIRIVYGLGANAIYASQYSKWQIDHRTPNGLSLLRVVIATVLMIAFYPLMVFGFSAHNAAEILPGLITFPADLNAKAAISGSVDHVIERTATSGAFLFDGISATIRTILDAVEFVTLKTPWPITVMTVLLLAWRVAGFGVMIFSAVALFYLGFLGYWEDAMTTVALLGTAVIICCMFGIPIGIWFGKNKRVYGLFQPVLDFMQSMPAFVYLIPVIAFFGIGKPPAILATLIFGMPPVIRLTALGIQQVPADVKEAAIAFGANKRFVLFNVEIPLSLKSIMTGANQTTLMCLSMVVIAALIGAKGLGQLILQSLQYAAEGEGILAGIAILFCAMVIDRVIQGLNREYK